MNIVETQTVPRTTAPTPVVVTEHEVMLASAAALLAAPSAPGRRAALAAWFAGLRPEPRRHPRSRRDVTEYARMAREMDRL